MSAQRQRRKHASVESRFSRPAQTAELTPEQIVARKLTQFARMANLSDEESKRAFDTYAANAQKRLEHDQQFPDEPKQLRPGEDVRMVDGKVSSTNKAVRVEARALL